MTTNASQTASASNTENTKNKLEEKVEEKVVIRKNTKGNRKVLVARYTEEAVYKLPNNLDLEDESVVKEYWVKWGELFISYTSLENWEKYTNQPDDEDDFVQETSLRNLPSPEWIQAIQLHYDCESDHECPYETEIENAEDWSVDYEQDEDFICECCLNKLKEELNLS